VRAAPFLLWVFGVSSTAIALVSLVALIACGESLPHPPYSAQATSALEPIAYAPPPGRIELIPRRPAKADAWVDGEWVLQHGRWYWLLGRWVKTPAGTTFSPWVVVRARDGRVFYAPGVWKDAKGSLVAAPPALAFASGDAEAVFNPEGEVERTGRNIQTADLHPVP